MKIWIQNTVQAFIHDNRGVAYIEFALSLPFLILLFAGSVDVTRMVLLHQKLDKAVFTVGDLATQLDAEQNVCNIIRRWENTVVRDVLRPFRYEGNAGYQFVVSSVIGARGAGNSGPVRDRIEWRYPRGANSAIGNYSSPYAQQATLPPTIRGLRQNERIIVTEMRYRFNPLLPLLSTMKRENFRKVSYFRSRISTGKEGRGSGVLSDC